MLVDVQEVDIEISLIQGEEAKSANPLGTDYDLADIFIGKHGKQLDCSPFLHVWTASTKQKYSRLKGVWLFATSEYLFLRFGKGCMELGVPESDTALFFPIPDDLLGIKQSVRLVVTCMN